MNGAQTTSMGSLAGMGAGAAFGGPMGAMIGGSAGGMIGSMFGGDDEATQLLKRAQAMIAAIPEPTAKDLQLILQPLVQQGVLSPEAYSTFLQSPSEFLNIDMDQTGRNAEIAALGQLQDIAANGGNDAQFRAAMNNAYNATNQQMQGQSGAILQNAAARGALNSNMTTAAQLANAYAGNANMANASTNAAAEAEKRALDAITQSATLGGNLTAQDWAQQSQRAQAIDAINRYNAQNQQSQANMNTQSRNLAQAQNLDLKQQVANQNNQIQNDQARYNAQLPQQMFQNSLAKAGAMAGIAVPTANLMQQNAQNQAATQGNLIGGLGQNLTNYYNNQNLLNALKGMQNPSAGGGTPTVASSNNAWGGWGAAEGGPVPGQASFPGNDPRNDTVRARLSPGEFVLDREAVHNPVKLADIVSQLPAMQKLQGAHPEDIQMVLEALTGMRRNMWKGGYC